jgi:hypothetical protein
MATTKASASADLERLMPVRRSMLLKIALLEPISTSGSTVWEELTCVGYNPQTVTLEAVVAIKQSTGYSGGLCSAGSKEFVRFFIDYGAGFQDVGYTSFDAHDIPGAGLHPIDYSVRLPLPDTGHRRCCQHAVIPTVRAVLSWGTPPSTDPNVLNTFGNRMDVHVQLAPSPFSLQCLIESGALNKDFSILETLDLDQSLVKTSAAVSTSIVEMAPAYREAKVADHRLLAPALYGLVGKPSAAATPLSASTVSELAKLKIDVNAALTALTSTSADTTYEQITCVGLEPAADTLGAVIQIKRPLGYSGDLCHAGSKEYVAFWADWNNDGTFDEYLGTATVDVHDLGAVPMDGVRYSVALISSSFVQHLRACAAPNVIRIRAVLSWAVPPSTTDPNALEFWGNRVDALVQIRPGIAVTGTELTDLIYRVGGVALPDISSTTHLAYPSTVLTGSCGAAVMDRPWGGTVSVQGRIYNTGAPGSVRFRVRYKKHAALDVDANWTPVTFLQSFVFMHPFLLPPEVYDNQIAGTEPGCGSGWFDYREEPLALPPVYERDNRLADWATGTLEGEYDLRVEYRRTIDAPGTFHISQVVTIVLHNHQMSASMIATPTIDFSKDLDLVIDGGDCHSYAKGGSIQGHLRAQDAYFWTWSFDLEPSAHTHGAAPTPNCRTYTALSDFGDANLPWSLDTTPMDKCGYTLTLRGYDRTILNSVGGSVHAASKAVGFAVV